MSIDFTLPPDVEETRRRVREFMDEVVRPAEEKLYVNAPDGEPDRSDIVRMIIELRQKAHEWNVWLPHMPKEWGGLGLGITAMAFVSAEAARTNFGPFILNAQAPDEGNQHTLLHHANDEQKEKYLRPLLEGRVRSCFAMTEPEVAGSDPTGIRTMAVQDGDEWVINGHKWFISGAKGATFAILIAKTDPDADPPQASNTAFLVDLPADGLGDRARHRHDGRPRQPLRDPHHRPARAGLGRPRWSGQRPPARPGATRPRAASRTACVGSARPRPPSRCS